MKTIAKFLLAGLAVAAMSACSVLPPSAQAPGVAAATAGTVQSVQLGQIVAIRRVRIAATPNAEAAGGGVGAILGGLLGSKIGGGIGRDLAAGAGALAGAAAGNSVADRAYAQAGVELTIRLYPAGYRAQPGALIAITQAFDPRAGLRVGERVQIVSGGGAAQVLPI